MLDKNDFIKMLKCIRCGSFENLRPYKHAGSSMVDVKPASFRRTHTTYFYKVWTQDFPVCNNCYEKFEKWKKTRKIYHGTFCAFFFPFWIILFIFVTELIFGSDSITNINIFDTILQSYIIYIIVPVILIVIVIIVGNKSYKHKISKNNPNKYMDCIVPQLSKIKPENSKEWIFFDIWADLVLKERIQRGTMDPTLMVKFLETIKPRKSPKSIIEKGKIDDKNIKYCPNCGNLVNLSKGNICIKCFTKLY